MQKDQLQIRIGLALLFLLAGTVGCSHRQMYDSTTGVREQDCERYPPRERDECLRGARTPYDEYRRQRDDAGAPPGKH